MSFRPSPMHPTRRLLALALGHLALAGLGAPAVAGEAEAPALRSRVLDIIDRPAFAGLGGWQVDGVKAGIASGDGLEARLGAVAITVSAKAKQPGGKVDVPLAAGDLADVQRLGLEVAVGADSNVDNLGLQVVDAKGEVLLHTVPCDWSGWKRLEIAPADGSMRPAWNQKGHDGKVDLPLKSVALVWFAKQAGPTSLAFDALTAVSPAKAGDSGVTIAGIEERVIDAGEPLAVHLVAENRGAGEQAVRIRYSLQANPAYIDQPVPHPVLGRDHASGASCTLTVDGVARAPDLLCDGDDATGYATPWGRGFKEAVATIDLGETRTLSAVHWVAGDANWINQADVAVSTDGTAFTPVAGAQGVVMHGKWGGPHAIAWNAPVAARHLRLRFHNGGKPTDSIRLPHAIKAYDGIANDQVAVPRTGAVLAEGTLEATIPARDHAGLVLRGDKPVGPGAYLLGCEVTAGGTTEVRWSHLFVRPDGSVDAERARRFGINGADASLAADMRRCGFGWMRFENAKWAMYMPKPDQVVFDGSAGPWYVDIHGIFTTYQAQELKVLPYVFQTPEWATSAPADTKNNRLGYPPRDPADYGEAIFQLVARYGRTQVDAAKLKSADKKSALGMIDAVELWNEPNLTDANWGPFVGTSDQYFAAMRAGAEGARRADPTLPVSSAGWAGIDLAVVGKMTEHKYADGTTPLDLVDIINVHFYSGREEPEICGWDPNVHRDGPPRGVTTYPQDLEALVAWRDQHKPKAELWLTEIGNDVGGPMGRGERHQAAKLPRGIMLALAAGIDRVFIYREKGSDPTQHAGAGLLRNDGSTRPVWLTVATMIRQLQGFTGRAQRLAHPDPTVWLLLWEQDARRVLAAWTTDELRSVPLGIELGQAGHCDAFGRRAALTGTAGVALGYAPIYLALAGDSPALGKLVAGSKAAQRAQADERKRLQAIPLSLFDFGGAEHVGMFKGWGLPRRFTRVGKDRVWDEQLGHGFSAPAFGEEDQHWIGDALDRDGCRIGPGTTFRLRLPPGSHTLRISATPNGDQPLPIVVTAGDASATKTVNGKDHVAEFTITADQRPIEVGLGALGCLRWISAVPATP